MKRFLALLLLCITPAAYGQVNFTDAVNVPNTVVNSNFANCPAGVDASNCGGTGYGGWVEGPGFQPGDFTNDFGSTEYAFSYVNGVLTQNISLSNLNTNAFNFFFDFDLNNSCRNSIGGSCGNVDGPIDEFSAKIFFYDQNGLNNSFTFLSGNPSTARIECNFEVLGLCLGGYTAYDNWQHFGWYSSVQSDFLFDYARIEFTGRDVGFWGGLYGPRIDNVTLQINYLPEPYPVSGGDAGMNVSAPGSDYIFIYKGNDPVLFSQLAIKGQDLVDWYAVTDSGDALRITSVSRPDSDYLFLYTEGVPVSGSWYSFQETAPTVDCVLDPFDPTCIIDTLGIGDTDDTLLAYTTDDEDETGSDDGSDDGSEVIEEEEEEVLVADDATEEETDLEDMLSDDEEETDEEIFAAEDDGDNALEPMVAATYRELTDEEKAAILADAIAKDTIQGALAIASDASAATNQSTTAAVSSESTTRTTSSASSSSMLAQEVAAIEISIEETKQEMVESAADSIDALETGRQLGKESLAAVTAASEQSATDSINQAESIAASSSELQAVAAVTTESSSSTFNEQTENKQSSNLDSKVEEQSTLVSQVKEETATEIVTEQTSVIASVTTDEVVEDKKDIVADVEQTNDTQTQEQQIFAVAQESEAQTTTFESTESVVEEKQEEIFVADNTEIIQETDTFTEIMAINIAPVIQEKDEDFEFVQQVVAQSQQQAQEETNNSGFSEDEKVTIANDPALANAFNLAPNMANLELTGALTQKQEEKSDAEKAADKVVAANKEEQEKINSNYMEADQSGIVAAIGADTDVTSYRTAMIRDNNDWYKPEDIYKGIIIKDNVRGSYFLEKGNTDTYKKMVEEQYK
jgi:hypothetical protein